MKSELLSKIKKNSAIKNSLFVEKDPEFISTGCYTLDILFSGQLKNGGIQKGRISQIASPSALGKSMIGLKVARHAQIDHDMDVFYIDTEFAYDPNFARNIGIDLDRMVVVQNNQIEDIQQIITSTFHDLSKEERDKILIVIDSWGGLVTSKTINDAIDGKDVTDMTIAKKKNSLSRIIMGLNTTSFVVNQIYDAIGNMAENFTISGGRGLYFSSSAIVLGSSKAKSKAGDEIDGAIITAITKKGRNSVEHSKLKYLIKFNGGIHRYYGLLDDALEGNYIERPTQGWYTRPCVQDDKKWREKEIWDNAKEFWTPIIETTDFPLYIEKKYSFKHNTIMNEQILDEDVDTLLKHEEELSDD